MSQIRDLSRGVQAECAYNRAKHQLFLGHVLLLLLNLVRWLPSRLRLVVDFLSRWAPWCGPSFTSSRKSRTDLCEVLAKRQFDLATQRDFRDLRASQFRRAFDDRIRERQRKPESSADIGDSLRSVVARMLVTSEDLSYCKLQTVSARLSVAKGFPNDVTG
jgi:hypothetical protein